MLTTTKDSFGERPSLLVGPDDVDFYDVSKVADVGRLPFSLTVLLENLLRHEDGRTTTADHVRALAGWDPQAVPRTEIPFRPTRVIMQDYTGVRSGGSARRRP